MAGLFRAVPGEDASPWLAREAGGGRGGGGSATSTRAEAGSPIRPRSSGSRRSRFRLPGRTCGSRRGANAKLQATGVDAAGRRQYLYHPEFRAQQEQAKYDNLIRFAERLPDLREAMSEHMEKDPRDRERVSAVAVRLINLGWFRVGSERYVRESRTYGITTLNKSHVSVRGSRIVFRFRGKQRIWVRTQIVDSELADAIKELLALKGGRRLFRYEWEGDLYNLTSKRLNDYIRIYMGEEFTAKDFRTWGGTLLAAVAFAERGPAETAAEQKRVVAAVMRKVAERLGNTPAVDARLLRQPGGRRAVPRRPNDRRFPTAAFTSRRRPRYRSRSGGASAALAAPLVANSARARGCLDSLCRFLVRLGASKPLTGGKSLGSEDSARLRQLRQGSRRGQGRDAAPDLFRRAPRREAGRSLRRLRGEDAGSSRPLAEAAARSRSAA